jgi:hypothetical protein
MPKSSKTELTRFPGVTAFNPLTVIAPTKPTAATPAKSKKARAD